MAQSFDAGISSVKSWLEVSKFPHHGLGFLRKKNSGIVRFSLGKFWSGPWATSPEPHCRELGLSLLANQVVSIPPPVGGPLPGFLVHK